ncbi:MAG: hypothetical protein RMJ44_03640 [Cytophagales bacterium]|nr:hypothetical protein [Bernardetiaceae bacterium]MDW8210157.1 hypothetical protein [Cytophagales bacterium]
MRIFLKIGVYLCVFIGVSHSVAAQQQSKKNNASTTSSSTTAKPTESELKKLTIAFVDSYSKFIQTKDKASVLRFVHEKVSSSLFNASVSGKYRNFTSDYQGLDEHLNRIAKDENFNYVYKLTGIVAEHSSDEFGSVVYTADYQTERDGAVWEKGSEQVTLVFKKFNDGWKIIYYNSVNIENEKLRGDCSCEIFESKPGNFVTKTLLPSGRDYTEDLQNFEFLQKPEGRIIRAGNQVYNWSEEGEISYIPQQSGKPTTVSPTTIKLSTPVAEKEQAVILILREVNYKENCANIKVRKK